MADALQPAVHRPRAYQGAIYAVQAVVPNVEPPPAAEPAPQPEQLPNPPAEQLEVFYYFLVLLYLFVFVFSPMLARTPLYSCFLFSSYAFLLGFAFSLLASYITSFTFCLVVCWFISLYSFQYATFSTCFSHHCSFYLFLHSPFVSFFSFWYILVCISLFFAAFTSVFIFTVFVPSRFLFLGLH